MKFSPATAPRLALLLGIASASALGLTGWSTGALAQSVAAPATAVPPAAIPTVPPAATTNAVPPEVPAQGTDTQKPKSAGHAGRGMNAYLAALHDELAITPAEEPLWTGFADTMRESSAKLADAYRQRRDQLPGMSAIADMTSFIALEQLRLDGLKTSATAFQALYQTMPPAQQKVADTVFLSDMPGAPHHKKPKTDK
jgi:protein CpxP